MHQRTPEGSGEPARRFAFEQLRLAILRGDLAPGQRMHEPDFSERLGVTRGSVRAAMIDLAADGLVERVHNRGTRVRMYSLDEAVAITECRMALEGLCAARAASLATDTQVAELVDLGEEMAAAAAAQSFERYAGLNRQLHNRLIDVSRQRSAAEMLDRLNSQLARHHYRLALLPGRPQQSLDEHLAVIAAVRAGNPQAAEAAARAHLLSVAQALRRLSADAAPTPYPHPVQERYPYDHSAPR
ncbi:GntR family transcriptional regulator [Streptomyces sp. NPDC059785]|uniref:GntR family transcriptional regulator n=1 Tax=Streptomyces sp. NPDC059785 TaxID=3346945 RepID=UPI003650B6C7